MHQDSPIYRWKLKGLKTRIALLRRASEVSHLNGLIIENRVEGDSRLTLAG
jgi:hypothetical protein